MRKTFVIELGEGKQLSLGEKTLVVGVLNVTSDSFSDGGQNLEPARALDRALEMEGEGADIIEVGGESTRPGATTIAVQEELSRVLPIIRALRVRVQVPIAIDTYK